MVGVGGIGKKGVRVGEEEVEREGVREGRGNGMAAAGASALQPVSPIRNKTQKQVFLTLFPRLEYHQRYHAREHLQLVAL
jgi:hypothetical protein